MCGFVTLPSARQQRRMCHLLDPRLRGDDGVRRKGRWVSWHCWSTTPCPHPVQPHRPLSSFPRRRESRRRHGEPANISRTTASPPAPVIPAPAGLQTGPQRAVTSIYTYSHGRFCLRLSSNARILSACARVRPISSRPLSMQCLRCAVISKANDCPDGVMTVCAARSTVRR